MSLKQYLMIMPNFYRGGKGYRIDFNHPSLGMTLKDNIKTYVYAEKYISTLNDKKIRRLINR